ncbi:MAG: response regulator [Cellvibrionaceae bacterium]
MEKLKLLIIEDEMDFVENIIDFFGEDYEIQSSGNGENGKQKIDQWRPDIILQDLYLPDIKGYDVCRYARDLDFNYRPVVVFISGADSVEEQLATYDAGGDDFLQKPVKLKALALKLEIFSKLYQERMDLMQREANSRDMAFSSMTEASQYGQLLQYFKSLNTASSFNEVGEETVSYLSSLDLESVVELNHLDMGGEFEHFSSHPISPMEYNVLNVTRTGERLIHFGTRTVVNGQNCSILVKNMPVGDEVLYGRLADILAALIEALDACVWGLVRMGRLDQVVSTFKSFISGPYREMKSNENLMFDTVDKICSEIQGSFHYLGLEQEQEEFLSNLAASTRETTDNIRDQMNENDDYFEQLLRDLVRLK